MNKLLPISASALLLAASSFVNANGQAVRATVDGSTVEIPLTTTAKEGAMSFDSTFEFPGASFHVSGLLNPDPSIVYGLTVTDVGAPSSFSFLFSTPIVPTGPSTSAAAFVLGELTDATGDSVSITPLGSKLQQASVGLPLTSMNVDVGDAASFPAGVPAIYPYGPFSEGPIAGPSGLWTELQVTTAFTLSGEGDIADLRIGFAQIEKAQGVPDGGPGLAGMTTLCGILFGSRFVRRFKI
ncbi:MAG: hypothetical protein L0Z50_28100 [Verrucomicrobiales bacterium]|nr:hypothetical protein [Verrucomicrobiales bacterium]